MSLPPGRDVSLPEREPKVVDLDADDGAAVEALGSSTARHIVDALRGAPATPPELADTTDTTAQNVHYHLSRLEDADVVTAVDTVYSEKGTEMTVYAPAGDPLVLVAGDEDPAELERILSRALGAVAALAGLAVVVEYALPDAQVVPTPGGAAGGPTLVGPPPVGLWVFLAGLSVVVAWAGWVALRHRTGDAEADDTRDEREAEVDAEDETRDRRPDGCDGRDDGPETDDGDDP
ncbi:ArsR/SmtB family transcription factor [Halospeciosus flavus]|uniref:ArsR/SmtB family transcription factor n=1 Tax=Halospeciosus flavus TaxID=3032283 RepID=A0ABD5Z1R8_9EURY|nr:winged helix-turn-helix domain-containing protein [Halospeciosus flavus]